jgi:alpha,alpha-trehalase
MGAGKVKRGKSCNNINVPVLPINPNDSHFMKSLSTKPGILTLTMNKVDDGCGGRTLRGIPFIVTGTQFNEVYRYISLQAPNW